MISGSIGLEAGLQIIFFVNSELVHVSGEQTVRQEEAKRLLSASRMQAAKATVSSGKPERERKSWMMVMDGR
jgi:hypothetical protein